VRCWLDTIGGRSNFQAGACGHRELSWLKLLPGDVCKEKLPARFWIAIADMKRLSAHCGIQLCRPSKHVKRIMLTNAP